MPFKDPETRRAYERQWRESNRAAIAERQAQWYLDHRPQCLERQAGWNEAHRDSRALYNRRRWRDLSSAQAERVLHQAATLLPGAPASPDAPDENGTPLLP